MGEAVGILEVFGLTTAFMAADAGCKAGNDQILRGLFKALEGKRQSR